MKQTKPLGVKETLKIAIHFVIVNLKINNETIYLKQNKKLVGIGRLCSVPHHVFVIISHISKLFSAEIMKSFGNVITFQNNFIKKEKNLYICHRLSQ